MRAKNNSQIFSRLGRYMIFIFEIFILKYRKVIIGNLDFFKLR